MESLKPDLSLVIPTFRGEETLPSLVEEIAAVLSNRFFEIILVDDGSGGGTSAALQRICEAHEGCRQITLERNRGQQEATLAGLREGRGSLLVTLDDDGAHNPSDIPGLLLMLEQGYDLVFGVPRSGGPNGVKPGSLLRDRLFTRVLGVPRGVRVSSFRVFRRELLNRTLSEPLPRFIYLSAALLRQRPRCGCRDVVFRRGGPSRYGLGTRVKLFLKLFYFYGIRRPFRG